MLAGAPDLILIQMGTPPNEIRGQLGDLPDWFCRALGRLPDTIEMVRVFAGESLPEPDPHRIAVITGSWSIVTDCEPWSEKTAAWIRDAMAIEMPFFGVCYGHQLMAHALGGRVEYHPECREIGCQTVRLLPEASQDVLLRDLPQHFQAHLTHMQTIISLPPTAYSLAAQIMISTRLFDSAPRRYQPNSILSSRRRFRLRSSISEPMSYGRKARIPEPCLMR